MTQQLVVSWGSVRDIYVICCDFTSSQHKHSLCSQHISLCCGSADSGNAGLQRIVVLRRGGGGSFRVGRLALMSHRILKVSVFVV